MSPRFKNAMDGILFTLAILAIIFAIVQYKDSRDLQHNTRDLQHKLKYLLDEASTKYVGLFPENLDDINATIGKTQKDAFVLADFPGYGHYSQPHKYDEFWHNIVQLRQATPPKKIRMLFYSATAQQDKVRDQLKPEAWEQTRKSPLFKQFFGTFHPQEPPKTYDEFIKRLLELQSEYEKRLCNNGVEIRHIDQPSVLFFWLADEESAAFTINSRGKERELSFHTNDFRLIHSFRSIFDRFWHDSQTDPQRCPSAGPSRPSAERPARPAKPPG
jgi:hypothetical protein